jgi:hypothetical protein
VFLAPRGGVATSRPRLDLDGFGGNAARHFGSCCFLVHNEARLRILLGGLPAVLLDQLQQLVDLRSFIEA